MSRVRPEADARVSDIVRRSVLGAGPVEDEGLPAELGLSPEDTSAVLAAASFVLMALATTPDTPTNVAEGLQSSGVLSEADPGGIDRFLSAAFGARSALKETVQRARIAAATIPAFTTLHTSVDLRVNFRANAEVSATVPVLLVHIDTDSDQEICFQMSKDQLEITIERLKAVLGRIEAAERWAESKTPSGRT